MRSFALLCAVGLLGCASSAESSGGGSLRAGASKVKITPEKFGWLTGYGGRNKPADGVKADLWVRALALQDAGGKQAVLVTADILGFPPQLSRELRKDAAARFGLDESAVMFVASHTHGG